MFKAMVRRSTAVAGALAVTLALTGAGVATAAPPRSLADEVAGLIAEVAPDQGAVLVGTVDDDAVIASGAGPVQVEVPTDAAAPVVLDEDGPLPALEIFLPAEAEVDAAEQASDGTVVFDGEAAVVAAQVLDDGSVRLQTVTEDAEGPHEFTYTFGEGVRPVEGADGIELLADHGGVAVVVGLIDDPWAVDAEGNAVASSYEVRGDALVQLIDAHPDTAYPVVADPKVTRAWWNTTVYFNRNETAMLAGGAGSAAAVAALIPDPTISKIIAAAAGVAAAYITTVHATGNCIKAVLYGHVPPAVWQPYGGSEAGRYCR